MIHVRAMTPDAIPRQMTHEAVTPATLEASIERVRNGARMFVSTMTRVTIIDAKTVRRFEKSGAWLLKPSIDGDGIRLRAGKGSVYLMPGQLRITDEDR